MRGEILDYSIPKGNGIITAKDGNRYRFVSQEWMQNDLYPKKGMEVDFSIEGDNAKEIYIITTKNNINVNVAQQETSSLAIVSLVFGILAILFDVWTFIIPSIVAIVTGHIARATIKKSNGKLNGEGMALAGLILGYISLAVYLIIFIFIIGILGAMSSH